MCQLMFPPTEDATRKGSNSLDQLKYPVRHSQQMFVVRLVALARVPMGTSQDHISLLP